MYPRSMKIIIFTTVKNCNKLHRHVSVIISRCLIKYKGAFARANISAKFFAKVARLTIYCYDFSCDYNGFSISTDSKNKNVLKGIYFEKLIQRRANI